MSLQASDLDVLGDLAGALGLVDSTGSFREDWLSRPGDYLSSVLADDHQRQSLVTFVDNVLGGSDQSRAADGTTWLPIVERTAPDFHLYVVLDDRPADYVGIGLGLRMSAANPAASITAQVPLFRAAKQGHSIASPLLIGTADAVVNVAAEVTVDSSAPLPGQAHLGGVRLEIGVPTGGSAPPRFSLSLRQLQMPGATGARDLTVDASDPGALEASILDLVLGLVRAQAAALPPGPLTALAGLIGLRDGIGVPPLPFADVAGQGVQALATWLEQVLRTPAARTAWIAQLAALLNGTAQGDQVAFAIGPAALTVGVAVATGSDNHTRLTPTLAVTVTATADAIVRASADLCTIDLGSGAATALPRLALELVLGHRPDGGAVLIDEAGPPAVRVETVRAGFALDAARHPTFVLAADNVTIGGHTHATLDLSTPDAIADVGGVVLGDIADEILGQLGTAADAARILLGLAAPPGHAEVPTLDVSAFLQDPLGAIASHWQTVVQSHAAAVPAVITTLRDLIADAAKAGQAVAGAGTTADPWRVGIAGPVDLRVWIDGNHLSVAPAISLVVDTLGQRCTRVESSVRVTLVDVDLAARHVVFLSSIVAGFNVRARGRPQAAFVTSAFSLTADSVGLLLDWTPVDGMHARFSAPNLAVDFGAGPLALPIPSIDAAGHVTLTAAEWDKVEQLIAGFATAAGPSWLVELVGALGWIRRQRSRGTPARLRLADLVVDANAALIAWVRGVAVRDQDLLLRALSTLANLIGGTTAGVAGVVEGSGRPTDPWLVPLARAAGAPKLAVWIGPSGPLASVSTAPTRLQGWRPGLPGFGSAALVNALENEARAADDVAALLAGRPDVAAGLDALVVRWSGTDGRIVPPDTDPDGITVHRIADATWFDLIGTTDIESLLDRTPDTVVHVAVAAADALPWPDAASDRIIDLTTAGVAPDGFTPPAAATGDWYVALGGRAACRLAAGDADGIAGQSARLQRVLQALGGLAGGLVIVSDAEAGHAVRRAADAVAAVTDIVLLGTPLGPVSFTVLDQNPAADTLRLLARLLPPATDEIDDDPDLRIGRGLITGLTSLLPLDDPARELQPPSPLAPAPRPGLNVHAMFGVAGEDAVRRGITAVVAAGLAERSQVRAALPFVDPDELHAAIRIPLPTGTPASGDPIVDGYAQFEVGTLAFDDAGVHLSTARDLAVHCGIGRLNGWLVGGPDPARAPGVIPDKELRRVSLDVHVPVGTSASATATIVLHEPRAFGIDRERWIVQPAGSTPPVGVDAATPALPEVRILLSGMADALADLTSGPAADVAAVLRAIHVIAPAGGSVPDAIDHLLHDPIAHLTAAIDSSADRLSLVTALRSLFGDSGTAPDAVRIAAGPATLDVNLASRQLTLTATAAPGTFGLVSWTAHLTLDAAAGTISGDLAIGDTGVTVAGGLELRVATPLAVTLDWHRPGLATPERIPLWPTPDANALARAVARLVPAELLRVALESLRTLDEATRPMLDAALDAVGLLSDAAADGARSVRLPIALVTDPAAWFQHGGVLGGTGGLVPARVIALIDALKPILGVAGGPGEWAITSGITVRADTGTAGAARLTLTIDTSAFAPIPAAGRLSVGGSFGLAFPADLPPRPAFDLYVGVSGAATPGRQAAHVAFDGAVQVFLRPATGADIPIYPNAAGLGQLAQSAITQALPFVLDRLAALAGQAGIRGDVGTLVASLGDALGVRTGGHFSGAALQAWATDPAAALVARLPAWSTTVLGEIAGAVRPLLPGGVGADVSGSSLQVHVGVVTVLVTPAPLAVVVSGEVTGVPAVSRVQFDVGLSGAGLTALDIEVGPADIDAGGARIRPFFGIHAGSAPAGGRRAELSLGLGADRRVGARWLLGNRFDLVVVATGVENTDPAQVALALLDAVLDIVASFVMSTAAFTTLLNKAVGASTVRDVLRGVLLDNADPGKLDANLFDPAHLLGRLQQLAVNVAQAAPAVDIDGLTIGLAADDVGGGVKVAGVRLSLAKPVPLVNSDITISLETDARWIHPAGGPPPPDGIVIDALRVGPGAGAIAFAPGVSVNGVGLRFAKGSGPLLDIAGVTLGSIALHLFGRVGDLPPAGGVELQFSDLAVGVGGASGGNPVAQGIVGDTGQGPTALAPKFSPALAIQKYDTGPVLVSLRAGDGSGPWWLAIQKGFGPLYIEQVGFGVTVQQDQLQRISLLLDGRVSLLGLTAAVDDLQLTFVVASNASIFDPSRWAVDLAGLAISSNLGGITLEGGLKKFGDGDTVQYVGMLMGRFAVYGLSVFGGYGHGVDNGQRYASFFAFGAVNGPIGGPPAFFVTGIGGGLGINRLIVVPTDLSHFDQFPFIKALDPSARPSPDPMAELTSLATYFPQARGSFWFAAGISFTSFALVDGIVVVSVEVGDGLQIAIFGLARMALPRPQFPIVSIELGLIARFSSKEGVLWVQAQLTDNSWLLYPDVRLTGGFAYVMWFLGANAGQFVLTIGGYHPNFHRDGYPEVPRLGLQWRVTPFIAVKGESYFALTSEAIMAGVRIEVSATFGPAWAHLVLGADGIVYYDPFHFEVTVYASISAGVTIDVWIGEITISVSIGARILVEGPNFHGVATFSVGPVDLSVEFGDPVQPAHVPLPWADFVRKYLEEASPGVARVLTAVPGKGALPPGTGPGGATDTGTADGSAEKPFTVFAEFELMVTSTMPTPQIMLGAQALAVTPTSALGIAPMNIANAGLNVTLTMIGADGDHTAGLTSAVHHAPSFPIGVWGPPQPNDDRKVPSGDVIDAIDGVLLSAVATIPPGLPPIDYHRVETGKRLPLPFVNESSARPQLMTDAGQVSALLPPAPTVDQVFAESGAWMARAGNGRTAVAAMRKERAGPPRFGTLTDGLADSTPATPQVALRTPAATPPVDTRVHIPVPIAVISSPIVRTEQPAVRTTVKDVPAQIPVRQPPTLDDVAAKVDLAVAAQLHLVKGAAAAVQSGTIIASGVTPLTRVARSGVSAVSGRGAVQDGRGRLDAMLAVPTRDGVARTGRPVARDSTATTSSALLAGEVAVLRFPNAARDLDASAPRPRLAIGGGPARVVTLAHGGAVLADTIVSDTTSRIPGLAPPIGTERVAVAVAGDANPDASGLSGWHAQTALAYIGWETALGAGSIVRVEGTTVSRTRHRRTAGWVRGAELVEGTSLVITRFVDPISLVVVALDDPSGTNAGRNLSLGITGATRPQQPDGSDAPPRMVVRANRTFLIYDIALHGKDPVTVTVASEAGWHLAGVMGGTLSADVVVGWLSERGIETVVRPVLPGTGGARTLTWVEAQPQTTGIAEGTTRERDTSRTPTSSRRPASRAKRKTGSTRQEPPKRKQPTATKKSSGTRGSGRKRRK